MPKRSTVKRSPTAALLLALLAAVPAAAQGIHDMTAVEKVEVFLQHLGKVARVAPESYQSLLLEYELAQSLSELGTPHPDPLLGDFIRRSLEKLHPEFAGAAAALAGGKHDEAAEAFRALELKGDPYLSAYARLQLAEIDSARGNHAEAMRRAEEIIRRQRQHLLPDHRACELVAIGFKALDRPLLEYLQYWILLIDFKDVPAEVEERVKARLAALEEVAGRPVRRVAGWMDDVEKLLESFKTAEDPTRNKQGEILTALDKLIELQEARERNT